MSKPATRSAANTARIRFFIKRNLFAPQTLKIASHLNEAGSITGVEASAIYKCRSLPRRIKDIRDSGIEVKSETRFDLTGQRYVRYVLE